MMKFALIVPTLNAGTQWQHWLEAFNRQTIRPNQLLIIDSESNDDTVDAAKEYGFEVKIISRSEFDHGGTRQYGVSVLDHIDVCVFLTQDAILSDVDSLSNILKPFHNHQVAAVCGRQLPKKQATHIEAHARLYNYPATAFSRSIKDANIFGLKAAFLSNSFAAYRLSALSEIGGFPDNVIFGEDMYVATKLLLAGYMIAYASDACVYHSHAYTVLQEMNRYFDMGVFHAREPWIRRELGAAEGEGMKFMMSEIGYLFRHSFWRIPEGLLRTLVRYTGFRLGLLERYIPLKIKRKLSMNPAYFNMN
jgi:rhamnosyltransferase